MSKTASHYCGYRLPPEIISHAVWHLDEVFVKIMGKRHYLWRAVDQEGDVIDILLTRQRNATAAKRFFRRLLVGQGAMPWRLVTHKLRSYVSAQRSLMPSVDHCTTRYANNRAELSHQPMRQRERHMRGFKSAGHIKYFLSVHGVVQNLCRIGRRCMCSSQYRLLREASFKAGTDSTAV